MPSLRSVGAALVAALLFIPAAACAADPPADAPAGTIVAAEALDRALWVPEATGKAFKLTYTTTDGRGRRALSTGELLLPKGAAPEGGWPVVSWAHGTSGLGDACAPSVMGPALPERDFAYLRTWLNEGYAIVASDYAGLGTDGLPAYLHGRSEASNVVDAAKAARRFARAQLRSDEQLSGKWVAVGQSQGGGAAIYTARYATEMGGESLDYRGAVGTGTPAYIEAYVSLLGPGVPPVSLPPGLTAYMAYILASLRDVHPELGIDAILTDTGKRVLALAETACVFAFEPQLEGVVLGDFFTQPLATLPGWTRTINDYMAMPESGFDKPFFMGHGATDTDVPYPVTALYATRLQAADEPVTFRTYPSDHSGTLNRSQADSRPFVRALLEGADRSTAPAASVRALRLDRRAPRLASAMGRGLRFRLIGTAATAFDVVARRGGRVVGTARATTSEDGTALTRLRFTPQARRAMRSARRVRLEVAAGGAATVVTLRR